MQGQTNSSWGNFLPPQTVFVDNIEKHTVCGRFTTCQFSVADLGGGG